MAVKSNIWMYKAAHTIYCFFLLETWFPYNKQYISVPDFSQDVCVSVLLNHILKLFDQTKDQNNFFTFESIPPVLCVERCEYCVVLIRERSTIYIQERGDHVGSLELIYRVYTLTIYKILLYARSYNVPILISYILFLFFFLISLIIVFHLFRIKIRGENIC